MKDGQTPKVTTFFNSIQPEKAAKRLVFDKGLGRKSLSMHPKQLNVLD